MIFASAIFIPGVDVQLSTEASVDLLRGFDDVVVATGIGTYRMLAHIIIKYSNFVNSVQALTPGILIFQTRRRK